jgi:endonuclease YncB( thermonuclease family)
LAAHGVGHGVFASRALVALAVIAAASAGGWWLGEQRHDAAPRARVIDVIDGDTIVVAFADGSTDTICLLGVDTPKVAKHHLPTQARQRIPKTWPTASRCATATSAT